jgi:8-oxo-dGTP diphosphatase
MPSLPFKISVLVFVRDDDGRHLLIRRAKEPNKDCWSPIGGKLEMSEGESPFECAVRETKEEIGLDLQESDLHLFSMISERGYEGSAHWLMFLFDCKKRIQTIPENIDEGKFGLFTIDEIQSGKIKIPETDQKLLWDFWKKYSDGGMVILRADCTNAGNLTSQIQQIISK